MKCGGAGGCTRTARCVLERLMNNRLGSCSTSSLQVTAFKDSLMWVDGAADESLGSPRWKLFMFSPTIGYVFVLILKGINLSCLTPRHVCIHHRFVSCFLLYHYITYACFFIRASKEQTKGLCEEHARVTQFHKGASRCSCSPPATAVLVL